MKGYLKQIFFILATFLFSPLFFLSGLSRKKDKQRILVIQTAKIGDLVCSTPVFREIKKNYPESRLAVLVLSQAKGILRNNPHINEIITFSQEHLNIRGLLELVREIKKKDFNWSFSLVPGILNTIISFWTGIPCRVSTSSKYETKGSKILSVFNNYRLEYKRNTLALKHYLKLLKFIGINQFSHEKEIFLGREENEKISQFLERHNLGQKDNLIGISVTAGKEFKEWAPEKFAQLADRAAKELKAKTIFIGGKNDEVKINEVRSLMENESIRATQFNLIESAALLKRCSLFISVDTGPLYIADTVGTPVIDIAGPCQMKSQRPSGRSVIVQKPIDCGPCSYIMSAPGYCQKGHSRCIRDISVDDVFRAVLSLLNKE